MSRLVFQSANLANFVKGDSPLKIVKLSFPHGVYLEREWNLNMPLSSENSYLYNGEERTQVFSVCGVSSGGVVRKIRRWITSATARRKTIITSTSPGEGFYTPSAPHRIPAWFVLWPSYGWRHRSSGLSCSWAAGLSFACGHSWWPHLNLFIDLPSSCSLGTLMPAEPPPPKVPGPNYAVYTKRHLCPPVYNVCQVLEAGQHDCRTWAGLKNPGLLLGTLSWKAGPRRWKKVVWLVLRRLWLL